MTDEHSTSFYQDYLLSSLTMIRGSTGTTECTLDEILEMERGHESGGAFEDVVGPVTQERVLSALAQLEERGLLDRLGGRIIRLTDKGFEQGKETMAAFQGREKPYFLTKEDVGIKGLEPGTPEYEEARREFTAETERALEPILHTLYMREKTGLKPTNIDTLLTAPDLQLKTLKPDTVRDLVKAMATDRVGTSLPESVRPPHVTIWDANGTTWVALTPNGRRFAATAWRYRFGTKQVAPVLNSALRAAKAQNREIERRRKKAERQARKKNRRNR